LNIKSEKCSISFVIVFLFKKKLEEKEGWNERLIVTATFYFK
jgi:hypothetical protein